MNRHQSVSLATFEADQILRKAGVPEARREAASLLAHVIGRDRTFLITNGDYPVMPSELRQFFEYVKRRAAGEPMQYIVGSQEFFSLSFEVTPDVLIPRPETELLVEKALELIPAEVGSQLICDVGIGSGCILISILHERKHFYGLGLDISVSALKVAGRNARRHHVDDRLVVAASDGFSALMPGRQRIDMIVSNPPYVPIQDVGGLQREVKNHEPWSALIGGEDGLQFIKRLLLDAPDFLRQNGFMLFEIGFGQHEKVTELVNPVTWTLVNIYLDLQSVPRTVVVQRK